MAKGVEKTFKRVYRQNLAKSVMMLGGIEENPDKDMKIKFAEIEKETGLAPRLENCEPWFNAERLWIMERFGLDEVLVKECQCFAYKQAYNETDRATYQAMEALIHNLNTMHSRAGAQTPFSSINYGMDTSPEGRMAVKNLLLATEAGLGNGETPIFPVQIYRVKEGINYNPGEPNYDLFQLAIRCSAKRLFPNFAFVDAPFNLQYYKPGHPETEIAYMGAVTGEDVITIRVDGKVMTLPFAVAYDKYANIDSVVEIMDRGKFVKIKAWQNYPDGGDWFDVKFSNGRYLRMTSDHPLPTLRGRVMCEDLVIGDEVPLADYDFSQPSIGIEETQPPCDPWVLGVLVCDGNRDAVVTLAMDEKDIADALVKKCGGRIHEQHRNEKGDYLEVFLRHGDEKFLSKNPMQEYFGSSVKRDRRLPEGFLTLSKENRRKLLAGIIDADGYLNNARGCHVQVGSTNKTLAIEEMQLAQSLGYDARMYKSTYGNGDAVRYQVSFRLIEDLPIVSSKKRAHVIIQKDLHRAKTVKVIGIDFLGTTGQRRYDVTTESDRFDVSGINSHNCRTRVIGNVYDPSRQVCNDRGNLSFTTINLPRLGIKAKGDLNIFFESLDHMMDLAIAQLLERFEFQCRKKVKNFPFLMGQGVWIDSADLDWEDELREVLKHGTLSVGFIGLAETLVALIGEHHGQSKKAQELGLKIIGHMRDRMDKESKKRGLNITLLATPAEGLSGRFVRIDKVKYGEIPGVTDRDYYTNSFHVPVYYPIGAYDKIAIEAPYHAMTNAGHISYIEMDGDPTENLDAFERVIRCMKENGIGYGSVNHPVDRDPVCGFSGIIGDTCPGCGRKENDDVPFERIRRITGYLVGTLDRFNDAKRAEERDRVKHST